MSLLSLCIPTYNRKYNLNSLLASISNNENIEKYRDQFEVCISDNSENSQNLELVKKYKKKIKINYHHNKKNIGRTLNYLKSIELSKYKYVWLVGDDDLLSKDAIKKIINHLITKNNIDFFFVNAINIDKSELQNISSILLKKNSFTRRVAKVKKNKLLNFFDLINPLYSKDFLGGMYLYIFNKKYWLDNQYLISKEAIYSKIEFSHFDNTFPHVKIISKAFHNKKAYYISDPLLICVSGYREWSNLSAIVNSFWIVEILNNYRRLGMPYIQYVRCKNFAYRYFIPDLLRIIFFKKFFIFKRKFFYFNILNSLVYPNTYISFVKYLFDKYVKISK